MVPIRDLIELLEEALRDPQRRSRDVKRFQSLVWESGQAHADPRIDGLLRELAYDLDFYESDDQRRAADPSYYGDARLEDEIRSALQRLHSISADQ